MSRQARKTQPRTLIDYAGFGPPAIAWSRRPRSEESLRFGEQLVARAHRRAVEALRPTAPPRLSRQQRQAEADLEESAPRRELPPTQES